MIFKRLFSKKETKDNDDNHNVEPTIEIIDDFSIAKPLSEDDREELQ